MIAKIMECASVTALLLVVSMAPYANYQIQILIHLGVCAGAVMSGPGLILNQTQSRDSLTPSRTEPTQRGESLSGCEHVWS